MPTEVGTPVGEAVRATIGAEGGMLAAADGRLTVVIPAGALSADTALAIQPITNTAPGGRGQGYELSPDGQTFAEPVELRFRPNEDDLAGTALPFLNLELQEGEGYWQVLDADRDTGASTLSVTTAHFSHYSPSTTLSLVPSATSVEVESFKEFVVQFCSTSYRDQTTGRFATFCKTWQTPTAALVLGDWSVNGVKGGNSTLGVATYTGPGSMSYEAPEQVPSDNPVTISIDAIDNEKRPIAPLTSQVRITPKGNPYSGTATWTQGSWQGSGNGLKATATVEFQFAKKFTDWTDYTARGSIAVNVTSPDCKPLDLTLPLLTDEAFSRLTVYDESANDPATYRFLLDTQLVEVKLECTATRARSRAWPASRPESNAVTATLTQVHSSAPIAASAAARPES